MTDQGAVAAGAVPAGALGRRFWLVWTSTAVSTTGDGVRYVALPLLAADLNGDPRAVALVFGAGFLPWPLFGLLGGAIADRGDRRRLMWSTDLVRAVVGAVLTFAVAVHWGSIAVLAVAAFALGTAQTLFDNAASAILPMVVPYGLLERANSWLLSAEMLASALIGPPIGASLYLLAPSAPFAVDAVSFLVAAALVGLLLHGHFSTGTAHARASLRQDAVVGLRWLWKHRLLRTLCLLATAISAAFTMAESLLVLYSAQALHLNGFGYSLLLAVVAVGGTAGSAIAGALRRRLGPRAVLVWPVLVMAGSLIAMGLTSSRTVSFAALAMAGLTSGAFMVATVSLRQRLVPAELLGRVTSSYRLLGLTSVPVGAGVAGVVAKVYGIHAPYLVGSALVVLALLASLPVLWGSRWPVGTAVKILPESDG